MPSAWDDGQFRAGDRFRQANGILGRDQEILVARNHQGGRLDLSYTKVCSVCDNRCGLLRNVHGARVLCPFEPSSEAIGIGFDVAGRNEESGEATRSVARAPNLAQRKVSECPQGWFSTEKIPGVRCAKGKRPHAVRVSKRKFHGNHAAHGNPKHKGLPHAGSIKHGYGIVSEGRDTKNARVVNRAATAAVIVCHDAVAIAHPLGQTGPCSAGKPEAHDEEQCRTIGPAKRLVMNPMNTTNGCGHGEAE